MEERNDGLEEFVDSFYDWVCPELVHDEDRSWRVGSVLWAIISTEQGTRTRETRRTPGLRVSGPMRRTYFSSVSSGLACAVIHELRKAANMVLACVEILVKTSCEEHVGPGRGSS